MKVKIGTQMDERVFRSLKVAAARQGKSVGSIVEEAVAEYLAQPKATASRNGIHRFLGRTRRPLRGTDFLDVLRSDYYDQ